jgi:hypothetical protein
MVSYTEVQRYKNDYMWVSMSCPACLKKIGLESRFIGALPFKLECPYCKTKIAIIEKDGELCSTVK